MNDIGIVSKVLNRWRNDVCEQRDEEEGESLNEEMNLPLEERERGRLFLDYWNCNIKVSHFSSPSKLRS